MTRNLNENYGQLGGGTASQPYRDHHDRGHQRPGPVRAEWTTTRSRRASTSACRNGLQYTVAYTFAKAIDWWAGTIPQPEYWHLNKGDQANSNPHMLNISVIYELPFGIGTEVPERLRRAVARLRRVAGERVLHRALRDAVHGDRSERASLNAGNGTNQRADQVKDDGGDQRVLRPVAAYFD